MLLGLSAFPASLQHGVARCMEKWASKADKSMGHLTGLLVQCLKLVGATGLVECNTLSVLQKWTWQISCILHPFEVKKTKQTKTDEILNILALFLSALFLYSGSLCIVQTDHLPLEKLHTTWLSCLLATEECQRQAHTAAYVYVPTLTSLLFNHTKVTCHKCRHHIQQLNCLHKLLRKHNCLDLKWLYSVLLVQSGSCPAEGIIYLFC